MELEKRLKKDLKRTKALLVDAQLMLDHLQSNTPSKREITQLKNQVSLSYFNTRLVWSRECSWSTFDRQSRDVGVLMLACVCVCWQLEESEFTCAAAVKARKSMELELEDLHIQMEDMSKAKIAVSL